jgi:hypothetical protein
MLLPNWTSGKPRITMGSAMHLAWKSARWDDSTKASWLMPRTLSLELNSAR